MKRAIGSLLGAGIISLLALPAFSEDIRRLAPVTSGLESQPQSKIKWVVEGCAAYPVLVDAKSEENAPANRQQSALSADRVKLSN